MKGECVMKRLLCVLLILCAIPVCVSGEKLNDILPVFNVKANICGASELTGEFNRIDKTTYYMLEYRISDVVITGFMEKLNGEIDGGYVVCLDPSKEGDFLALCAAHALTICGDYTGKEAYQSILEMFLAARQKKQTDETIAGNMLFSVYPISTGIAFNYSIIKK